MRSETTTLYPGTNAVFSPDEKYVATGVGATSKAGQGRLLFLNRTDLSVVKEVGMESTPVKVVWHSKINQIITGLSNGMISVLYSAGTSTHGAKLLLSKGAPKRPTVEDMSDALAAPTILTPHALPMFKDGDGIVKGTKRKREKDRQDPRKSRRPELPVTGPGKGGRVGASATQHVVQNLVRDTTRDEDVSDLVVLSARTIRRRFLGLIRIASHHMSWISFSATATDLFFSLQPREALLKYARLADTDPQWTGGEHGHFHLPFHSAAEYQFWKVAVAEIERLCIAVFVLICRLTWRLFPSSFFFPAWRQNQPKPVFANVSEDEEET